MHTHTHICMHAHTHTHTHTHTLTHALTHTHTHTHTQLGGNFANEPEDMVDSPDTGGDPQCKLSEATQLILRQIFSDIVSDAQCSHPQYIPECAVTRA